MLKNRYSVAGLPLPTRWNSQDDWAARLRSGLRPAWHVVREGAEKRSPARKDRSYRHQPSARDDGRSCGDHGR